MLIGRMMFDLPLSIFIDDGGLDQRPLAEGPSEEMFPLEGDLFPIDAL